MNISIGSCIQAPLVEIDQKLSGHFVAPTLSNRKSSPVTIPRLRRRDCTAEPNKDGGTQIGSVEGESSLFPNPQRATRNAPPLPTDLSLNGSQFGMYVMFPIGIMYYFGTNLDNRFAVPDFWPKPEQANKVPLERDEIHAELERLRARRLYLRDKRLAAEAQKGQNQSNDSES